MNKLISTKFNPRFFDVALLILRVCVACFMLVHGLQKLGKFFSEEPISFADPLGIGVIPSLALTVFAEVFCSFFVLVGFATRLAVIPLMTTMTVAAFIVLRSQDFGKKELALVYLLVYLVLLVCGGGKYSLDGVLENKIWRKK